MKNWNDIQIKILYNLYENSPTDFNELFGGIQRENVKITKKDFLEVIEDMNSQNLVRIEQISTVENSAIYLRDDGKMLLLDFYRIWLFYDQSIFMIIKALKDGEMSYTELFSEIKKWENKNLARELLEEHQVVLPEKKWKGRGTSFISESTFQEKLKLLVIFNIIEKIKLKKKIGRQFKTRYRLTDLGKQLLYFVIKELKEFIFQNGKKENLFQEKVQI